MKQQITPKYILQMLQEIKELADNEVFRSSEFKERYRSFPTFRSIIYAKGLLKKNIYGVEKWCSILPNIVMAQEVYKLYKSKYQDVQIKYAIKKQKIENESIYVDGIELEELISPKESIIDEEPKFVSNGNLIENSSSSLQEIISKKVFDIDYQKKLIEAKIEKIDNQDKYNLDLENAISDYKELYSSLEKEFTELKNNVLKDNSPTKPNKKKIKILGIPIYSIEY
jgi:hypothetical protein